VTPTPTQTERKQRQQINKRMLLSLATGGLFIGMFLGWLTMRAISVGLLFGPPSFNGTVIPLQDTVSDFTLRAHNDQNVHLSDFRGKVTLLYFGYTYCPDICPATLAELASALKELQPAERQQVQVLMVTVDPERDTPEVLANYLNQFDASFLGLSGSDEEIAAAADSFGIFYQKREGTVESGYLVDHTASVAAVDKKGHLRLIYSFGTPGSDIAEDLQHILNE
jgi:protein SCO1/2